MISLINGTVFHIEKNPIGNVADILTSSGIGYQIHILDDVKKNDEVILYLISSFDANGVLVRIYGYGTPEARKIHNLLTDIQGLGSSNAFNLLSMGVEKLLEALEHGDESSLKQIKGVGPKLIQKIFSYYNEKKNNFPSIILRNADANDNLPTRQEIKTLGSIIGINDNVLLERALILAKDNGAQGAILYREAAKIIKQEKVI